MAVGPTPTEAETAGRTPDRRGPALVGYTETDRDGEETYTVAPAGASETEVVTTWLTVSADAVVDLDEMR